MKTLTLLILLVLGISSIDAQVVAYKSSFGEATYTADWDDATYFAIDPVVTILLDIDDSYMVITNSYEDKFYITDAEVIETIDEEYRLRNDIISDAYDKDMVKCKIVISYFEKEGESFEGYEFRIRVAYTNIWYGYYANPLSTPESDDWTKFEKIY